MTMKNIASPCGIAALLSAALLGLAPAAHAQLGAFNDPEWPQQEPSLGNSTAWGVRLPEGRAAAQRPDGSSYPNDPSGIVLLSRGLSQGTSFSDPQPPSYAQDALKWVNPNGTIEVDPTPYVHDKAARYGQAALAVLTSGINNNNELAGVAPTSKVYSFRFTGETPTEKEVIGTLNHAGSYAIPIVTLAVDPIHAAGGDFSRCSGDLQSAIDRAYKKGTLLFVDSRNTLLGNCNNVMLVGPVGPKTYSRPNSKTQIVAPDRTWVPDVQTGSFTEMSGMAPVIAAGAAVLTRGPLLHRLDPGMRLNAEVLRAALRAGTELCPDCVESARTPLNLQRTMEKVVEAAEGGSPVGSGSGRSMMLAKKLVSPSGVNVVSGSLELVRECVPGDLKQVFSFACEARYRGSDWYYVPDLQGKDLSISLLQRSAGAFGLKVVRRFADGSRSEFKDLKTKPCEVTTQPCTTSDSLRIPADANVTGAWIVVSAYSAERRPYDFMLYAVKN